MKRPRNGIRVSKHARPDASLVKGIASPEAASRISKGPTAATGVPVFEIINAGFIHRCPDDGPDQVAVGSRCTITTTGEIVCSYAALSSLGSNNYVPMLSRSNDGGRTWSKPAPVWPRLRDRYSIMCSISRSPDGELFLFGMRTPIDSPGESVWSQQTLGMKQNELIWARSSDQGRTWSGPHARPVPLPGAAEAAAPMCITRSGRWLAPYSPSPTLDPNLKVDRSHVVLMISDDEGNTWRHTSMMRFMTENPAAGEAWVVELADGRLLGTCWQVNLGQGDDYPNPYALSFDNGETWRPTRYSTIMGQSTALEALPDGWALFIYNQRIHDDPGVWLAVINPRDTSFGIKANQIIWRAQTPTQSDSSGRHEQWTDFAFGEPSITLLPDQTLLATLWCIQPSGRGIRFVKLKMT